MARIVYITENWIASEELITSIAACGHEVQVWTGQNAQIEFVPNNIQILQPFKYWNMLDLAKLLPLTFSFQPQMIHLIPPEQKTYKWFSLWKHLDVFFKNIAPVPTMMTGATLKSLMPAMEPSPLEQLLSVYFTAYVEKLNSQQVEKFLEMLALIKEKRPELHAILYVRQITHNQRQKLFERLKFWKIEDQITLRQWDLNAENLRLILQSEALLTLDVLPELNRLVKFNLRLLEFAQPLEVLTALLKPQSKREIPFQELASIDESVNQINRLYAQALQPR